MGWIETGKEKAREHLILGLFALIALLLLVIWQAFPSEVWGKVSEVTPKRVLWALLGLEAIAIGLQAAFALDNRRKRKNTPPNESPKYYKKFGILWDSDADPRCPVCQTLMHMFDRFPVEGQMYETIICPKCKARYSLKQDNGNHVWLVVAKNVVEGLISREPKK